MVNLFPLRLDDVSVRRQGVRMLGPITMEIGAEEFTAVIGPNGSGKTTLLRLMHGLERPRGGLEWAAPIEEVRRHQAFVFQTPIMMRRSVGDSIAFPLRLSGMSKVQARKKAEEAAEAAGLGPLFDKPATMISGGERQKLAVARALIASPRALFLDEPCASLDGPATREIESQLMKAKAEGIKIIMSTHDIGQARRLADEVIFLVSGEVKERGEAESFFAHPETEEARAFLQGDIVE